jgi:hypothetical protein
MCFHLHFSLVARPWIARYSNLVDAAAVVAFDDRQVRVELRMEEENCSYCPYVCRIPLVEEDLGDD